MTMGDGKPFSSSVHRDPAFFSRTQSQELGSQLCSLSPVTNYLELSPFPERSLTPMVLTVLTQSHRCQESLGEGKPKNGSLCPPNHPLPIGTSCDRQAGGPDMLFTLTATSSSYCNP